jgi:hypothetical protein
MDARSKLEALGIEINMNPKPKVVTPPNPYNVAVGLLASAKQPDPTGTVTEAMRQARWNKLAKYLDEHPEVASAVAAVSARQNQTITA